MKLLLNIFFITFSSTILYNSVASEEQDTIWRYSTTLPTPLAFWKMQEATGTPRQSIGIYNYNLVDGNVSAPIEQSNEGVFGSYSAYFPAVGGTDANNSQRLYAARDDAPGITKAIAGPNATVTLITWMKLIDGNLTEGMMAGVWDEYLKARQYAIFNNLGACYSNCPVYKGGLASHISNCGGPTPGQKYCITRACDPRTLLSNDWQCLANVYNGTHIMAYVNGTFIANGDANPYYYPGGIYSPEANDAVGAEFAVGANMVNKTVGSPPVYSNRFKGKIGGVVVFDTPLSQQEVASVCAEASGFESLRYT